MPKPKRILITAPTEKELEGVRAAVKGLGPDRLHIGTAVTGVGMVNTALHLADLLSAQKFDLVIQIGLAGSFGPDLGVGQVVQVAEDRIAWFGAEDLKGFLPIEQLGLCPKDEVVFCATAQVARLPKVKGITVNMAHGSAASIRRTQRLYAPQTESMEGAAFFRVCRHFGTRAVQVRAISNRVEPRNRDAWNIPLALHNLSGAVAALLQDLNDAH
ncbi:MAG: futalosine hydrolase [Flavobacteriales bacterium]|nr:futalosine hydrolase [Flavobacteriales bacterium]